MSLKKGKERGDQTLPHTPVPLEFLWQPTGENDTYTHPQDLVKPVPDLARSPTTFPPSPPMSPPVAGNQLTNRSLSQESDELYDTVQSLPPSDLTGAQPGGPHSYNHLIKRQMSHKYEHLQGAEVTGDGTIPASAAVPMATGQQDNLYATVDTSRKVQSAQALPLASPAKRPLTQPQPQEMYSTVDTSRKTKNSTFLPVAEDNLYSTVDTAKKNKKKPPVPALPAGPAPLTGPAPLAAPAGDLYATVDTSKKRRKPPLLPVLPKSPDSSANNALYTLPSQVGVAKGRQAPPPTAPKPGTLGRRPQAPSGSRHR